MAAAHSPIRLACLGAVLYRFDGAPVRRVEYEDAQHYQIHRSSMQDRTGCLGQLRMGWGGRSPDGMPGQTSATERQPRSNEVVGHAH